MMAPVLELTDSVVSSVAGGSPPVQALTLDYVKLHLRSLGNADDLLVRSFIDAAASYFETDTARSLLTTVREAWLDAFPFVGASGTAARIELPHPPLQTVDSITYTDGNGLRQTLDAGASPSPFLVRAPRGDYAVRGTVEPVGTWPVGTDIRIRYTTGYGDDADAIPALVRAVLCMLVANYDVYRSAVHEARQGQVHELPYAVRDSLVNFKYTAKGSQRLYTTAVGGAA